MNFPENFVWGAAAASYQVEGAAFADGKGLSVWDMMCRTPGKIWSGNTGNVSCDHYHHYREDAKLMGQLGLQAYRLSISWPRVLPLGIGQVNRKGLDFYDRLVDALLSNNVQPWITLFHWDYPYELYCRGGWLNTESPDWFAEYTRVIVDRLSDRVTHWMTLNEPQCFIGSGHQNGELAPGLKLDFPEVLRAAHHTLLAHGKAVQVIRARSKQKAKVGMAPVGVIKTPASSSKRDIVAARKATFAITSKNLWNNTWWMDPVIFGHYPADGLKLFEKEMPAIGPRDMQTIRQPLDFYGVNIYNAQTVKAKRDGWESVREADGPPLTTMIWKVSPQALYWGPRFLYERYKLPLVITENGMANCDWVQMDGCVHDPQRIDFMRRYLLEYRRAIKDGVKCLGYFYWSIMDNFEWLHGYKQRFGLVFVDYATGKRIPKDSAWWYKEVIATNGAILDMHYEEK
jgi:beta-glucosidase